MTKIEPENPPAAPAPAAKMPPAKGKTPPTGSAAIENSPVKLITLDQLAREMKVPPREARMLLRLAAKQKSKYPNLGKEHVARQPWSWTPGSKALDEARKALASAEA